MRSRARPRNQRYLSSPLPKRPEAFFVGVVFHAADIQDRDGAPFVLASIRSDYPWLRHVFADAGYAGDKLKDALTGARRLECRNHQTAQRGERLRCSGEALGVEQTLAWLGRCRRLAKDFEATIESALAGLASPISAAWREKSPQPGPRDEFRVRLSPKFITFDAWSALDKIPYLSCNAIPHR